MNESSNKDESLDDIQRFVESQRSENTNKKITTYKCLETVLCNRKRSKKVRRNTCKLIKYFVALY